MCCAINGHILREPVRSRQTQRVYERATIDLWLSTHGHVCPVGGKALVPGDLYLDERLRDRILRWHVSQAATAGDCTDDLFGDTDMLYDF